MKLVLSDLKLFKDTISIVSELVNEVTFNLNENRLELVAIDAGNVAMVQLRLLSSNFTECEVEGEEKISLNLSSLKQILRRAKSSEVLTMSTNESHLELVLQGKTRKSFTLPLLDDGEAQTVPPLEFPVNVTLPSSLLSESIDDMSVVSESMSFMLGADTLSVMAKGDLSDAHVDIPQDEDVRISSDGTPRKSKYGLEFLKKMVNGSKLSDVVIMSLDTNYPLRLDYGVPDKIALSFILAPRVDND